jgi:hypothetical protein
MAITRLLQAGTFNVEQTTRLTQAYDNCLTSLGLVDRTDPLTEIVARKVIEIFQQGEDDPQRLAEQVLAALGIARTE